MHPSSSIPDDIPATALPACLSVCIVTNQWHPRLNDIFNALSSKVSEILVGFDGDPGAIPLTDQHPAVKVLPVTWEGYSNTKNKLASMAQHDWILSLDSDEVPDARLAEALAGLPYTALAPQQQYRMKRLSFFEGRLIRHGAWGHDSVTRLYNRNATQWDQAIVHESLVRHAGSEQLQLPGLLYHYTADDHRTFLKKSERYARLSAGKYKQQGRKATAVKRFLSPAFTFLKEYVLQGGFLDGAGGWKLACGNARYTYLKYRFLRDAYKGKPAKE